MSAPTAPSPPTAARARLWRAWFRWARGGRRRGEGWRSRRGVVALEFAFAAPVLLILMGAGVDFGMLLRVQIAMASGLMNAVQYANVRGSSTTAADLRAVMQKATKLNGMTVSVDGPGRYCPSGYPVTLSPLANATTCPGAGKPANTYVIITANYSYIPLIPGFSQAVATTVTQSATAMLE